MKKNGYKITTYIFGFLFIITLGFLLYDTRNPPTVFGGFTNNAMPLNPSNPHVEISFGLDPEYAINVDGHQFERGTYKRISDSVFSLKANNGKENGVAFSSNKGSYLFHSKLKKKLISIEKFSNKPEIKPGTIK